MHFGAPWELVSDRGKHFLNKVITNITEQHQIQHGLTTPYNPKANGLTEKAGLVCKVLKRIIEAHKTDWDRKLASAVHANNGKESLLPGVRSGT
jgi:transposase InsO family protein